ncbi:helix-turn-helix domain-containing protein [Limnofasciculus baicalensis]|uniref:Helix-turn-helix domain-containing protein n=1 Tax=Limnofasciculus baicalensis BBK-W-15 TaxID=2699891 RepID=A0AAE3GUV8_9CYAN|nr:helix-turn-helix domain-containing protein [Limnofasciculus baicalensis]MCP2731081.1 helix-turn-helix domain-containing protein [Limnofasciculus baicalensis BBK-W-15]
MQITTYPSVLTLEETAQYLRLSPEVVVQQANIGKIPGQEIDRTWRFLKSAIDDWLRCRDGRTILLRQAGAFADDDTLTELEELIYHARQESTINLNNL